MKKFIGFAFAVAIILTLGVIYNFQKVNEIAYIDAYNLHHLAWCNRIYHQNASCPKHGEVWIPPWVISKQKNDRLQWCEKIYHQNIICPMYGKVVVPPEVIATQKAQFTSWCNQINHRNRGCPFYKP